MKLKYSLTLEDKLAYACHEASKSKTAIADKDNYCKVKRRGAIISAAYIFIIVSLLAYILSSVFVFCLGLTYLVLVLLSPADGKEYEVLMKERFRGFYTEKTYYINELEVELNLTDYGLISNSKTGSSTHFFAYLSELEETDEYVFIYLTNASVLIIPKKSIIEGNLDSFMLELRNKLEQAG